MAPKRGGLFGPVALLRSCFVMWVLCLSSAHAQLFHQIGNHTEVASIAQLWYEGYWKEVTHLEGAATWWPTSNAQGRILLIADIDNPYEPILRQAVKAQPLAIIILRETKRTPGFPMFLLDGKERNSINVPVFESTYGHGYKRNGHFNTKVHTKDIVENSPLILEVYPNPFKKVAETPFQTIMSIILSLSELSIICIGIIKLHQLLPPGNPYVLSVGPVICSLEIIGAFLRLIYTLCDPFYSGSRLLPDRVTQVFISISFPFSLSACLLLTFYWAEMLHSNHMKVVPFVSRYRKSAYIAVGVMFTLEILGFSFRGSGLKFSYLPIYIAIAVYVTMSLLLIVSYIITSLAVVRRLSSHTVANTKKRRVRRLSIRIGASVGGYILFIISIVGFSFGTIVPWTINISLNCAFLGINFASLLQVIAIRPASKTKSSSLSRDTSNTPSSKASSNPSNGKEDVSDYDV